MISLETTRAHSRKSARSFPEVAASSLYSVLYLRVKQSKILVDNVMPVL